MFENPILNKVLDHTPKKYWNTLSNVLSFFSLPTIGSPIKFRYKNLELQEYDLRTASDEVREKFFTFCYPADEIKNPRQEYEIDKQYWASASTFIISRRTTGQIVGCIQFVQKTPGVKLPVEHSQVKSDFESHCLDSDTHKSIPKGSYAEIYRCRRSFDLTGRESVMVVTMLFKAIWAKTVQCETEFAVITCNAEDPRIRNLYLRKLAFVDSGVTVYYEDSPNHEWAMLYREQAKQERSFATLSKGHFAMQTWFRTDMKKKNLKVKEAPEQEMVLTPEDTALFATVVKSRAMLKSRPRGDSGLVPHNSSL